MIDSTPTLISLDHVWKTYQIETQKVDALCGVSLQIKKGQIVGITGRSGSGKSTLLHIIGLLDRPSSGTLTLQDIEASSLNDQKASQLRNAAVGFVFQMNNLLPEFSALENVMIPQMLNGLPRHEAEDRAEALLAMVGLQDRKSHRPGRLSGGEQQRVAIARAVANAPRVLLADEPTGNLDPETAEEVFSHLRSIVHGTGAAALIVTHNERLAKTMDRRLTIEDGVIVER